MNKREQGMQYRVLTLKALAHLGYATTRQIAKIVWGQCDGSSKKMAGRTLRWLHAHGFIVTKRDGNSVNGEQLTAVTAAGAEWLAKNGAPLPFGKAHARDWLRHAHSHRTACNSVYAAVVGMESDRCAWSELEIRAGLAPLEKLAYSHEGVLEAKIPDVLIQLIGGLAWVEVENSWRSDKDLDKAANSIRKMFYDERIAQVHFVITAPGAKTIGARLRRAFTHDAKSGWPRQRKELDSKIVQGFIKIFVLNSDALELATIPF